MNVHPVKDSPSVTCTQQKRRELSRPPFDAVNLLLNGNYALHVQREMRGAVKWVLARLDLAEGDGD
jgi:hypothetical protein